jgi:hypothetical protein
MRLLAILIGTVTVFFGLAIFVGSVSEDNGRGVGSFGGLFLASFGFFFYKYLQAIYYDYDNPKSWLIASLVFGIISTICLIIKFKKN